MEIDNRSLFNLEKKKYKGIKLSLIFLIFLIISIGVIGTTLFSKDFQMTMNSTGHSWDSIFDGYFIFKVILNPILLALLASKSVELENQGNMWKFLKTCGVDLKEIFIIKLKYIFSLYFLYQLIEWVVIIGIARLIGLKESLPIYKFLIKFFSQLSISFLIMVFHYLLALRFENQLITISVSLIGTLIGIMTLYISKFISYIVPYSMYGLLTGLQSTVESPGVFKTISLPLNYLPLIIATILGLLLYTLGKKYFKEVE